MSDKELQLEPYNLEDQGTLFTESSVVTGITFNESNVINYLQQREFGGQPLAAVHVLTERLAELKQGRRVPVVIFNCLDFAWQASSPGEYPRSMVLDDPSTAISAFFQEDIKEITRRLKLLGNPQLSIVVPDSELFDDRPFSHVQDMEQRITIAKKVSEDLSAKIQDLESDMNPVILWSEYCETQGLITPMQYTTRNHRRIISDNKLMRKIKEQVKHSRKHFERMGMSPEYVYGIPDETMIEKVSWYCAMYAGEGEALSDSGAIVINLEDWRVPNWFQKGANGNLPIATPVNPTDYYRWRTAKNELDSLKTN